MKLLILTQRVDKNDDQLGFFGSWINEFSKHCELVTVVCLFEGQRHTFPNNVKIISLGKESTPSNWPHIIKRVIYLFNFYKVIWQERKNYDCIFVHMNIIYVLWGGWLWRVMDKKIGLWHAHGKVRKNLQLAERICDFIFTSTKEGCRLESNKVKIVGQGIDIDIFSPAHNRGSSRVKIITIGRISPVKDYETLIGAAEVLMNKIDFSIDIIGGIGLADQVGYLEGLKLLVAQKMLDDRIKFLGPIPNSEIVKHLHKADLFVNMSHTGSMDKAILEAMACGLPVVTCNEALLETLEKYRNKLFFDKGDFKSLADEILLLTMLDIENIEALRKDMRKIVVENHDVKSLIKKILAYY